MDIFTAVTDKNVITIGGGCIVIVPGASILTRRHLRWSHCRRCGGNNKSMILTTPKSSLLVVKLVLLDPYKVEVMTEVFNSAATTKYGTNI